MTQFNYMSGSSIDNVSQFLFQAFESGKCYLGFGKGTPEMQWGVNSLIMIDNTNFPTSVASDNNGSTSSSTIFFDINSVKEVAGANEENQTVSINFYLNSDISFENPIPVSGIGELKLMYMNKDWAIIQGLSKYYYTYMEPSSSGSYYIVKGTERAKILNKSFINVPYYAVNCTLWTKLASAAEYTIAASGLQRTINFLGETFISGLTAPESQSNDSLFNDQVNGEVHKQLLLAAEDFVLKDESGNILLENMSFVDINDTSSTALYTEVSTPGNSKKYLTFSYPYIGENLQYIKVLVETNQVDELAIWNEALPYESLIPTSDSNPPALDVSYLKNTLLGTSLFDVNGFTKIKTGEFSFAKEVNNNSESLSYQNKGFTIETITLTGAPTAHVGTLKVAASSGDDVIELYDFNGFVVGDEIFIKYDYYDTSENPAGLTYTVIEVDYTNGSNSITLNTPLVLNIGVDIPINAILTSELTTTTAVITMATTTDKNLALKNGVFNVKIDKTVPLIGASSPTENIYRQLFIAFEPKDSDGNLLTNDVYNGDASVYGVNFDNINWIYDNGLILYVANKVPIYRKWASSDEQFIIVI